MTPDTRTPAPLSPELAARLSAFASLFKGAACTVSLYPAEHPAIDAVLTRLVAASAAICAAGPVSLMVMPGNLLIGGAASQKRDQAVSDLAALLHSHLVGRLTVTRPVDAASWRLFLSILAHKPAEVRAEGGISRAWTTAGGRGLEVQELDYSTLVEERESGDEATWEMVVARCLLIDAVDLDEETLQTLAQIARDPSRFGDLLARIEEQASVAGDVWGRAQPLMRVLSGVLRHVARHEPASVDALVGSMAAAATRLSPDVLLELLAASRDGGPESEGVATVFGKMTDPMIARFVSRVVVSERGCTERLSEAFRALVPDPARQRAIASLARREVADLGLEGEDFDQLWSRVEELLLSYSDKPFVPETYNQELSAARAHSLEIEHVPDDPPARVAAWLTTIGDARLRALDLQMLLDLLVVEREPERYREVLDQVSSDVDDRLLVGDLHGARLLVEAMASAAKTEERSKPPSQPRASGQARAAARRDHDWLPSSCELEGGWLAEDREPAEPEALWETDVPAPDPGDAETQRQRRSAAARAVERLVTGSTIAVIAGHLNTVNEDEVEEIHGLCAAIGPSLVPRLAEALSTEGRARARQRLTGLLMTFGQEGRQSVDRLRRSPSAAVRRTAVQILRTFGGDEAVHDLAAMLEDPEGSVQREAVRALIGLGGGEAHEVLQQALLDEGSAGAAVMQELSTTRDENATPLFCQIVRNGQCAGAIREIYLKSIARLGTVGGRDAVETLREVLNHGSLWRPHRTREARHAIAAALARMKNGVGHEVLEEAAAHGSFGVRRIARRYL
ncbi:MAG TPA: HEAT repeat domain-containing protein [Vicinamibacterales bacterium]|nr:HEAT repeat domain-containing protein [Vicinamibacterales bacterium]